MKRKIRVGSGGFATYLHLNESDPNVAAKEHQQDYYEMPPPEQLLREQAIYSLSHHDTDVDEPQVIFSLWPSWR
jgi:hypothetical protein